MCPLYLVDFGEAFENEKLVLNIFGLYPGWTGILSKKSLRTFICLGLVALLIMSISMLIFTGEYKKLLESFVLVTIEISFLTKMIIFLTNGNKLYRIEKLIGNLKSVKIPDSISEIVVKDTTRRNKMAVPYRILIIMYFIIFTIMPFLKRYHKVLPIVMWLPYDVTKTEFFYPTFFLQLLIMIISAFSNSSMDLMYVVLTDLSCCQLDILMENLRRIDVKGHVDVVKDELKMCIIHHHEIIRLLETIQSIYSSMVFIQCIASVFTICIQGFQLIVVVEFPSVKSSYNMVLIFLMLFQIFCYCWFGQNIINKSNDVGEACYLSNWRDSDLEVRKILLIIMQRCQRPVKLKAKLFTLDIPMLITILRSSYSYMAILRTLYSK